MSAEQLETHGCDRISPVTGPLVFWFLFYLCIFRESNGHLGGWIRKEGWACFLFSVIPRFTSGVAKFNVNFLVCRKGENNHICPSGQGCCGMWCMRNLRTLVSQVYLLVTVHVLRLGVAGEEEQESWPWPSRVGAQDKKLLHLQLGKDRFATQFQGTCGTHLAVSLQEWLSLLPWSFGWEDKLARKRFCSLTSTRWQSLWTPGPWWSLASSRYWVQDVGCFSMGKEFHAWEGVGERRG